jgi:CBS domain-containing protein
MIGCMHLIGQPSVTRPLVARRQRSHVERASEAMAVAPPAVSGEITVAEALRTVPRQDAEPVLTVVDHGGRALGLFRWADVGRIPRRERPALLLADLARGPVVRDHEPVADALRRAEAERADAAIVVDRRGRPVGLLEAPR